MVCPNCKFENRNTNIKCEKCGTVLIEDEPFEDIPMEPDFKENIVTDAKATGIVNIFSGVLSTIVSVFFVGFIGYIFLGTKSEEPVQKLVLLPFLICGVIELFNSILYIVKGVKNIRDSKVSVTGEIDIDKFREDENKINKNQNVLFKSYMIVFLLFWFGFLIFFDIQAIKSWSNGGNQLFFFSLIFWAAGVFCFIKEFKSK